MQGHVPLHCWAIQMGGDIFDVLFVVCKLVTPLSEKVSHSHNKVADPVS